MESHLMWLREESAGEGPLRSAPGPSAPRPRLRLLPKALLTGLAAREPACELCMLRLAGVGNPIWWDRFADPGLVIPLRTLWLGDGGSASPAGPSVPPQQHISGSHLECASRQWRESLSSSSSREREAGQIRDHWSIPGMGADLSPGRDAEV